VAQYIYGMVSSKAQRKLNIKENVRTTRRKYRRFRERNQFDHPLVILLLDLSINVSKLMLLAGLLFFLWKSVGS